MSYTKKQMKEEMEQELNEDLKKEKIFEAFNEYSDGAFDTWIGENTEQLTEAFIDDYNNEWQDFCKSKFNEENGN